MKVFPIYAAAAVAAIGVGSISAWAVAAQEKQEKAVCTLEGQPVPGFAMERLKAGQFAALHGAVAPKAGAERWTEIPWQADIQTARAQAARENKPLLLWIMDGHPLGCT